MSLAEANRGDAEQCLALSREHSQRGDHGAALRYAEKAARLCPDAVPLDALDALRTKAEGSPLDGGAYSGAGAAASPSDSHTSRTSDRSEKRAVSADQAKEVKRVLSVRSGDHYGVLGLAKSAAPEDIKRAYRRLALLLHPDKNTAPGADDAFKAVSRAFTVLSDPGRRAEFDRFGADGPATAGHGGGTAAYASDVSPEELFQMFFGGGSPFVFRAGPFNGGFVHTGFPHGFAHGFPHGGAHHGRRRRRPDDEEASPLPVQLMPVVFVLLLLFLSNLFRAIFG